MISYLIEFCFLDLKTYQGLERPMPPKRQDLEEVGHPNQRLRHYQHPLRVGVPILRYH